MNRIFAICCFLLLVLVAASYANSWQPQSILKLSFGDADEQFGYVGLDSLAKLHSKEPQCCVPCFAATSTNIYLPDPNRGVIKIFSSDGQFIRNIKAVRKAGPYEFNLSFTDISVAGNTIYVLWDFGPHKALDPNIRTSRFQIFVFDQSSGDAFGRYFVDIPDLGTFMPKNYHQRSPIYGSVRLESSRDTLFIHDMMSHQAYSLSRSNIDMYCTQTESWDNYFDLITRIIGVPYFSMYEDKLVGILHNTNYSLTLYNLAGTQVGNVDLPYRDWSPFASPNIDRLYEIVRGSDGPEVYELFANLDGVYIVRWRNEK